MQTQTFMKIAIPERKGRVSPVFDSARHIWVVHIEDGLEISRDKVMLDAVDPLRKARQVHRLGVDTLICGVISRLPRMVLSSSGVAVFSSICGAIDAVIEGFCRNRLTDECFRMPGTRRKRFAVGHLPETTAVGSGKDADL